MNAEEFRKNLIKTDEESLDDRVKRWEKLIPSSYEGVLPKLLFDYLALSVDLYIIGHYIATALFCASVVEMILDDQLKLNKIELNENESGFDGMTGLCLSKNIIDRSEKINIDKIRILRNNIIHANTGKLNKAGKAKFQDWNVRISRELYADYYLFPLGDIGIAEDALDCLTFTRDFSIKYYGVKE